MKPRPRFTHFLAYTQICVGLCLTSFSAVINDFFYFTIGLCNVFSGVIIKEKIRQKTEGGGSV